MVVVAPLIVVLSGVPVIAPVVGFKLTPVGKEVPVCEKVRLLVRVVPVSVVMIGLSMLGIATPPLQVYGLPL
jgi:hypothetical protein